MVNAKRTALIAMGICFGLVCVCSGDSKRPTVVELLDKYTATQEKLRSFVVKDVCKEVRTSGKNGKVVSVNTSAEFRTDGNRVSYRAETKSDDELRNNLWWGWLWDGEIFVATQRTRAGQVPNVIMRNHDRYKSNRMAEWHGGPLMGIMGNDINPIATIMRRAQSLTLEGKLKKVGKSKCYVVNAVTKYGKYTIWIDPQHGYHIAKAIVVKEPGDIHNKKPLHQKYRRLSFILKNVRFEKIDDLWVPMEADYAYNFVNKDGKIGKNRKHYKRIEMSLNPDHKALASFTPTDIRNGSPVFIEGLEEIKYTWQDGHVVGEDGNKVDLEKIVSETKNAEK